jgi:hypothetical protein
VKSTHWAIACLAASGCAQATETLHFWQNGLEIHASYAQGAEAAGLITATLAARRSAASSAAWTLQDGWRVLSGVDGGVSRVLQVRGEGDALEAISSELDTRRAPRPRASPPIWLPPASVITSDVEFLQPASRQWIARTAWSASSVASWLRLSARILGWEVEASSAPFAVQLKRQHQRLGVVLLPHSKDASGSIVVLTRWSST